MPIYKNFGVSAKKRMCDVRLCVITRPMSRLWRPNFGMSRLSRPMSRLSRPISRLSQPNFGMSRLSRLTARLMSRLSRVKLSARLCNLGLNPDVARPLKSGHESGNSTREVCACVWGGGGGWFGGCVAQSIEVLELKSKHLMEMNCKSWTITELNFWALDR